jgi:hypothetical protein
VANDPGYGAVPVLPPARFCVFQNGQVWIGSWSGGAMRAVEDPALDRDALAERRSEIEEIDDPDVIVVS